MTPTEAIIKIVREHSSPVFSQGLVDGWLGSHIIYDNKLQIIADEIVTVFSQSIDGNGRPTAALAYALWDSENTVRMKAECIQEHLARALSIRRWLLIHGCDVTVVPDTTLDKTKDDTFSAVPPELRDERDKVIEAALACGFMERNDGRLVCGKDQLFQFVAMAVTAAIGQMKEADE